MGVCLRYSKDSEEAQDVLQMGFIKVFEKLDMYNHKGSLEGWIRKIIVNTALDNIRKNKRQHIEDMDIWCVTKSIKSKLSVLSSKEGIWQQLHKKSAH